MDDEADAVAVLGTLAAVAGAITALIGVVTEREALYLGALLLIGGLLLRIEAAIRVSNGTRSPRNDDKLPPEPEVPDPPLPDGRL